MLYEFLQSGILISPRPGLLWIGWGDWRFERERPESDGPVFYAPDYFLDRDERWIAPPYFREISVEALAAELSGHSESADADWRWQAPDRDGFSAAFDDLQARFRSGELVKAVPVVFEHAERAVGAGEIGARLLKLLERCGPTARPYGFWKASEEAAAFGMLGATPEQLFSVEDDWRLETMALAGTAPKSVPRDALLQDPKEVREHRLVLHDLLAVLDRFGRVSSDVTRILELPRMYHLYTPVTAELRPGVSFENLVEALHPTPALGAAPRVPGSAWLRAQDEREPGGRGRFGAPFGASWRNRSVCLVGIRGIQWEGDRVRLGSGCGVIAQSRLDREWDELALKRGSVKEMLGL